MSPFHAGAIARRAAVLTVAGLVTGCVVACTATPADRESPTKDTVSAESIDQLVDIGGGRELRLVCQGSGSPTVLFISGTRGAADEWSTLLPDAAPRHGFDLRRGLAGHAGVRVRPSGHHARFG